MTRWCPASPTRNVSATLGTRPTQHSIDERLREEQTVHVLLNRATADGIADGSITVVLRRWDAARAKVGGTRRTQAGTIRIDDVVEYPGDYEVMTAQARAAGYRDAAAAHAALDRRPAKHLYVIKVSYVGADERPALAADDALIDDDVAKITDRLSRFDAASTTGAWTRRYLELIRDNEGVRAPDLAAREGLDVPRFKRRVRQLKGLGLTISLDVGYRISPRGKAFLELSRR